MAGSTQDSAAKAILYAFLANFGIALSKSWAAWVTGSGSMLAEAIHSYADAGNQVLLYTGLRQSRRPPDDDHPLGYGKLSYFWSFVVALLLFSLGGLFSIYEGFHKFHEPEPISDVWIALLVLGVAIVLEALSLAGCLREIRHVRGEQPFRTWLKHTRNAELVVVFGEDIAAIFGLCLAFGFLTIASLTGNPVYDAIGSMCIGVTLVVISIFIATRVRSLLVGRSAEPAIQEKMRTIITSDPDVAELYRLVTIQFGPDTMLAAKIRMNEGIALQQAIASINQLERRLKEAVPKLRWSFIEPDMSD
jgi:cation diffusion facilitator family transporter